MREKEVVISLTGRDSHSLAIPPGQGSLSIGTRGLSHGKYDLWVEQDQPINWDAFNGLYTGYGQEHRSERPYGDWPRWIYYSGNDTGFIQWSAKRKIEEFYWMPQVDRTVDFTPANIARLSLQTQGHKIQFSTGKQILSLSLLGTLENFDLVECRKIPALAFSPGVPGGEAACRLPIFPKLAQASSVQIRYSPAKVPFDCSSLLQFPNLEALSLSGSMTNLQALASLEKLSSLGLRYVPDLGGLPKLACWEALESFIGFNIEETAGKALRAELNMLKKTRSMGFSSVTQLRPKSWFAVEYAMPFSAWTGKNAESAVKAYKKCARRIKKSSTADEVHQAITEFIGAVNHMKGIETSEREDVGAAVSQLAECAPVEISPDQWALWFEEERDF